MLASSITGCTWRNSYLVQRLTTLMLLISSGQYLCSGLLVSIDITSPDLHHSKRWFGLLGFVCTFCPFLFFLSAPQFFKNEFGFSNILVASITGETWINAHLRKKLVPLKILLSLVQYLCVWTVSIHVYQHNTTH